MKVKCTVRVVEKDGEEVTGPKDLTVTLSNHWNRYRDLVVFEAFGKTFTLPVQDLRAAIENCTNAT
jgi:hypothetical protein